MSETEKTEACVLFLREKKVRRVVPKGKRGVYTDWVVETAGEPVLLMYIADKYQLDPALIVFGVQCYESGRTEPKIDQE